MKVLAPPCSRADLAGLISAALVVVAAGVWTWHAHGLAEQAQHRLRIRLNEQRAVLATVPAPTEAVAAQLAAAVAASEGTAGGLRRALGAGRPDPVHAAPPPPQRADAFFQIAQFVEAQRTAAQRAGVGVPAGTSFGFAAYSNSGPEDAHLAIVHRQQLVVTRLLEALWTVHPRELTTLQREPPAAKRDGVAAGDNGAASSRGTGRADELFAGPGERSAARPAVVDTLAFRIGFVGKTATLRRYLAALGEQDVPLMVREIAVQPLGSDGRAVGGTRSLADLFRDDDTAPTGEEGEHESVPIIAANESEFLVTVEYLDFASPLERGAADPQVEGEPAP